MRKTISPILMFLLSLLGGVSAWADATWYSPGSRLSIENIAVNTDVFIYSMCRVNGTGNNYSRFIVSNGDAAGTLNATPGSLLTDNTNAIWRVASIEQVTSGNKTGYKVTFKRNMGADGFLGLEGNGTTNATEAGDAHTMVVTQWKSDPYVSGTTKSGTDVWYEDVFGTPVHQNSMQNTDPIYLVSSLDAKSLNTESGSFQAQKTNGYPIAFYSVKEQTLSSLNEVYMQTAAVEGNNWASSVKWLRMKINSESWSYVETGSLYRDAQGLTIDHSIPSKNLSALWAIAGNEQNGYQFYNLQAGPTKVLGLTGSEQNARVNMVNVASPGDGVTTTFDITYNENNGFWYIKKHGDNNGYINCRRPYIALWDSRGYGNSGSSFLFESVDLDAFVSASKTATLELIEDWKKVPAIWREASAHYNAINSATLSSPITGAELTTCSEAVRSATESFLALDGTRITATNQATNDRRGAVMYLDATSNTFKGRKPSTYTLDEVMTLKPNDNFTFKLYNATANKYIGKPTGSNPGSTSAVTLSNAANFDLYTSNSFNDNVVVFCVNGTATMHLLNDLTISAYKSTTDPGSWWLLSTDRDNLKAALAVSSLIGTGVGHYTYSGSEDVESAKATAQALLDNANATSEAIQSSIATLNNIFNNSTINQPEVGKLYRFKGKASGKYMCASSTTAQMSMVSENNGVGTIFMLVQGDNVDEQPGYKFLSYGTGYYNKDTHSNGALVEAAQSVRFYQAEDNARGYYTLKTNTDAGQPSRYTYDNGSSVDRHSTYAANNCDWQIEEVTWLPISVTKGYSKLGTFVSPVALEAAFEPDYKKGGRLKFYTGSIDGEYFKLKEFTGEVIPANVPFLIEYQSGGAYDDNTGCAYLRISSSSATLGEGVANALLGGFETVAKPSINDHTIYTLQKTGEDPENDKQEFRKFTGNNVKGFRAYLPVPDGAQIRGMIFGGQTTDIESATTETAAPVIYDLSGRRVQHATKGMYIVNGKKMYVK